MATNAFVTSALQKHTHTPLHQAPKLQRLVPYQQRLWVEFQLCSVNDVLQHLLAKVPLTIIAKK